MNKNKHKIQKLISRAKSGQRSGANSGIFSNSGVGQKVDPSKAAPISDYAKTPGAQKLVRAIAKTAVVLGKANKGE